MMGQSVPRVVSDARFRAGRALVTRGKAEEAILVFAELLDETRRRFVDNGDDNVDTMIEAAPAYYEYGNALLRSISTANNATDSAEDTKPAAVDEMRSAAAAAAEKRMATAGQASTSTDVVSKSADEVKSEAETDRFEITAQPAENDDTNSDDDWNLSLEMMETAWSILDEYLEKYSSSSNSTEDAVPYIDWVSDQFPRYLTGIGDLLSESGRHADAADAYRRALELRITNADKLKDSVQDTDAKTTTESVNYLSCRRKVVEACVLLAEELLACPPGQDIVTTESKQVIAKANDRIASARAYYNQARDELQDTVLLMAQLTANISLDSNVKTALESEKEDVCYVSTLLMGVGMSLAQADDEESASVGQVNEPVKKKAKT